MSTPQIQQYREDENKYKVILQFISKQNDTEQRCTIPQITCQQRQQKNVNVKKRNMIVRETLKEKKEISLER